MLPDASGGEIVSRKVALERGDRHYFTGKPCSKGHIAKRRVGNWNCLACEADVRANPERAAYVSQWQKKNKDKVHVRNQAWRDRNREQHRAANRQWIRDNPDKANAALARRRARIAKATPAWVDHAAINSFYRHAARLTRKTGIPHEVDHIIPIAGKNVCGLHVHTNLQVIQMAVNRSKSNRF